MRTWLRRLTGSIMLAFYRQSATFPRNEWLPIG